MSVIERLDIERINNTIRDSELEVLDLQNKIEALEKESQNAETTYLKRITEEQDKDGKKSFTNELQRKIELDKRLKLDSFYSELSVKLVELKIKQKLTIISIDFEKRRFRIMEILSRGD